MKIIDFSQSNSIINLYMSELRDKNYQKNRLLFRHNITRIGEMMAYELSKTLEYKTKTITTPLGTVDIPLPKDDMQCVRQGRQWFRLCLPDVYQP